MVTTLLEIKGEEFRTVDRLTVFTDSFANLMQHTSAGLRHDAIRRGSDVEQEVAVALGAAGDHVEELGTGLPFLIACVIAPALVHRHARLPRAPEILRAEVLLWRGEVSGESVATVEKNVQLDLAEYI